MEILIILLLVFIYNVIFVKFNNKSIIFIDYFNFFLFYSLILFLLLFFFDFNTMVFKNFFSYVLYFLFFLSSFLTIGLKYINSPTEDIFDLIKKKKICTKKNLYIYLENKKTIKKRFDDLVKQKIIKNESKHYKLSETGKNISKLFKILKIIFNIKVEG